MHHKNDVLAGYITDIEATWWPTWVPILGRARQNACSLLIEHLTQTTLDDESTDQLLATAEKYFNINAIEDFLYAHIIQEDEETSVLHSLVKRKIDLEKYRKIRAFQERKNAYYFISALVSLIKNKPVEETLSFLQNGIDSGMSLNKTYGTGSRLTHIMLANYDLTNDDNVRLLLTKLKEYGADFNAKDKNGNTPLHLAVKRKEPGNAVKILIDEFGAVPEVVNDAGNNVIDAAFASNFASKDRFWLKENESAVHAVIEKRDLAGFADWLKESKHKELTAMTEKRGGITPLERINLLITKNNTNHSNPVRWFKNRNLKKMLALYTDYIHSLSHSMRIQTALVQLKNKKIGPSVLSDVLNELPQKTKESIEYDVDAWTSPLEGDKIEPANKPPEHLKTKLNHTTNSQPTSPLTWQPKKESPTVDQLKKATPDSPRKPSPSPNIERPPITDENKKPESRDEDSRKTKPNK